MIGLPPKLHFGKSQRIVSAAIFVISSGHDAFDLRSPKMQPAYYSPELSSRSARSGASPGLDLLELLLNSSANLLAVIPYALSR